MLPKQESTTKALLLAVLLASASPVYAKNKVEKSPFADGPYNPQENALSVCSEYGEGFYRVGSTGTCFRLGGSVATETRFRSSKHKGDAYHGRRTRSSSLATEGTIRLETVTPSDIGDIRMVIQATKEFERYSGPEYTR